MTKVLERIAAAGAGIGRVVPAEGGVEQPGSADDADIVGRHDAQRLTERTGFAIGPNSADNAAHGTRVPRNRNAIGFAAAPSRAY